MSRIYGLRPWDVDRLTDSEIAAYADDLRALANQHP